MTIIHGDGGYDSCEAFSHCKKYGVRTIIHVRIHAYNSKNIYTIQRLNSR